MKALNDGFDLATELRAMRPAPSESFTSDLDERVANGFSLEAEDRVRSLRTLGEWLSAIPPRRIALPVGAIALTSIVIATAVVIGTSQLNPGERSQLSGGGMAAPSAERSHAPPTRHEGTAVERSSSQYSDVPSIHRTDRNSASVQTDSPAPTPEPFLSNASHRSVERDASLVLRTNPEQIGGVTKRVLSVVHAVEGVVLSSSVQGWTDDKAEDEAGARFELLVPSPELSDTLASLSRIADVQSRRESTLDITAPVVGTGERLRDSRARIDGLLAELAGATSESERIAVEAELRRERRSAAVFHSRLDRLRQRARFARISLRIEGAKQGGSAGSTWGIGDALDDAGRILTTAAGVTLIGTAILAPLILLCLVAWLGQRLWVGRSRRRALGGTP